MESFPPTSDAAKPGPGAFGAVAVGCAAMVCIIGWAATTTAPGGCGNYRRDLAAQWDLLWLGPGLVTIPFAASWLAGRAGSQVELRFCRCAAAVALATWLICTGFVWRVWQ